MSLTSNIGKVAFSSRSSIDKIVGVWEGTYARSGATTRTSVVGTLYVHAIPHGLTRPVFADIVWSNNGTTWADGGTTLGGVSTIVFSDSTNIYVGTSSNTGTQHFKIVASWIDKYDSSDPLVDAYVPPTKPLLFDSRQNYQKIFIQGESSYSAGTFGSIQTVTINHDLGYVPNAKAFFEPIAGEVWPLNAGGTANPFLYSLTQDEAFMRIYNNRLEIIVNRFSNTSRKIWYKVYFDA